MLRYATTTSTTVLITNSTVKAVRRLHRETRVAIGLNDMRYSLIGDRLIVIIFVILQRYKKFIFAGYNQIK